MLVVSLPIFLNIICDFNVMIHSFLGVATFSLEFPVSISEKDGVNHIIHVMMYVHSLNVAFQILLYAIA